MDMICFEKILKFIEFNNSWKNTLYRESGDFTKPLIKYVRPHIDTRDMKVYAITLDDKVFRINSGLDIEELYKYLNDRSYRANNMK